MKIQGVPLGKTSKINENPRGTPRKNNQNQ
jgi:hypothetical protein